ncbi:MAG: hypothetical protein MUD00_02490 [Candidatus Pacebacteria bacterium]|jgi:hypothetical protein|nr:hypothetical protein [Candidatus Paceibacterota bacterium]
MKKTNLLAIVAIWMMGMAVAPMQTKAQSTVFTTIFTGMSVDQSGPLAFPYSPIIGGAVTFGLAGDYLRIGLEHNGGQHFRLYDTTYRLPVNTPATLFLVGFGVPFEGGSRNQSKISFAGSVVGFGYGPSFPSARELGTGSTGKLFLQLNCGGIVNNDYWIGGTFRGGLNLLWIKNSPVIPSWALEIGVVFGIPLSGK